MAAWGPIPDTGSRSRVQYAETGFLGRNRPVIRSPSVVLRAWLASFSTEPGLRFSCLATVTGSAAGSGAPGRGGPGQFPAISTACAWIFSSAAARISVVTGGPGGDLIWIGRDHSALSSWNPTPGQAARSLARISPASPELDCPGTLAMPIDRSGETARISRAPTGMASASKVQSAAASMVATRTVTATQASISQVDLARRTRKAVPSPRTAQPPIARTAVQQARPSPPVRRRPIPSRRKDKDVQVGDGETAGSGPRGLDQRAADEADQDDRISQLDQQLTLPRRACRGGRRHPPRWVTQGRL